MARNIPFLVAKRRNEHRRQGALFLSRLHDEAGIPFERVRLLDPALSVEIEEQVYTRLKNGIQNGEVHSHRRLDLSEAIFLCQRTIAPWDDDALVVLFCNHPDFSICCSTSTVAASLGALIAFDGDTITVIRRESMEGFALDVETEACPVRSYEVDIWGRR